MVIATPLLPRFFTLVRPLNPNSTGNILHISVFFFPRELTESRNNSGCSRNVTGMLMETMGCSEQLDPFCGSLIIEHLLMAWMFQQQGRLLVAIRLSFAVLTHVAVSMHTRVLKHASLCGLFIWVFVTLCVHVSSCIWPCMYVSACICTCGMYVLTHAWICFCTYACVFTYTLTPSLVFVGIVSCIMKDKLPRKND